VGKDMPIKGEEDIEKEHVIGNEVKQSHKIKYRLLRLPVRFRTQAGRFTSLNDILIDKNYQ